MLPTGNSATILADYSCADDLTTQLAAQHAVHLAHLFERLRALFGDAPLHLVALSYPDEPLTLLLSVQSPYNRNGTADRIECLFNQTPSLMSASIHFQILCKEA